MVISFLMEMLRNGFLQGSCKEPFTTENFTSIQRRLLAYILLEEKIEI